MPQFDIDPTLEVSYNQGDLDGVFEFGYNALTLVDTLPDSTQLRVFYLVSSVWTGPNETGQEILVNAQPEQFQESVQALPDSTYTVLPDSSSVTVSSLSNLSVVASDGGTYYYPTSNTVNSTNRITIRRSTDLSAQVVIWQPGSRVTSNLLNLQNAQVFNALQELTFFGDLGGDSSGGGGGGSVDLSGSNITELLDVEDDFGTQAAALVWNPTTGLVEADPSTGNTVPNPTTGTFRSVLAMTSASTYDWFQISAEDVFRFAGGPDTLDSWLSTSVSTPLSANTSKITVLEDKTPFTYTLGTDTYDFISSDLTTAGDLGLTAGNLTVDLGDVTVTAGDIDVTAGDVSIQGESVYDHLTAVTPYIYWSISGSSNVTVSADSDLNLQGSSIRGDIDKTIKSSNWVADLSTANKINFPVAGVYEVTLTVQVTYPDPSSSGDVYKADAFLEYAADGTSFSSSGWPSFAYNQTRQSGSSSGPKTFSATWMVDAASGSALRLRVGNAASSGGTDFRLTRYAASIKMVS